MFPPGWLSRETGYVGKQIYCLNHEKGAFGIALSVQLTASSVWYTARFRLQSPYTYNPNQHLFTTKTIKISVSVQALDGNRTHLETKSPDLASDLVPNIPEWSDKVNAKKENRLT